MVKHPVLHSSSFHRMDTLMSDYLYDMEILAKVRLKQTSVQLFLALTKQGSDNVVCLNALETL
jgi:hypothetical protein